MSTDTRRIQLIVAYDGTDYRGFAAQADQRTVQRTLTEAIRRVTGEVNEIIGASRTDSGAHAKGQSIHFDTQAGTPIHRWKPVLNRMLPNDLKVIDANDVDTAFHARFCAHRRRYRYDILRTNDDPFRARFAYAVGNLSLDLTKMQEAASLFVGTHDFRAFTEELDPTVENTVRLLDSVNVSSSGDEIHIDIEGTAFLRGMMRRISGFLWEVARGQRPAEDAAVLLSEARSSLQWPVVLPARGLCLEQVVYLDPPVDCRASLIHTASTSTESIAPAAMTSGSDAVMPASASRSSGERHNEDQGRSRRSGKRQESK